MLTPILCKKTKKSKKRLLFTRKNVIFFGIYSRSIAKRELIQMIGVC